MCLRGRYVGVAFVVLIEFLGAMLLGMGAASAEPRKPPFRTAQLIGPSSPEPPFADQPAPPPPAPPPPAPPPPPAGTPCPVDPPTPIVSILVRAPATGAAGQELEYRILVTNDSRAPAHHVVVRNPLPAHARFVRATPKPDEDRGELLWRLGTLDACANREIVLVLAPTGDGDVDNCARVQFEHGQCVTTRISRPQLDVRVDGPPDGAVDEPITFRVTVSNNGAVPLSRINLVTKFQQGWQIEGQPFERGAASEHNKSWDALAPGQSESVTIRAIPKSAGRLCLAAEATAAGGLNSRTARHCVNVGSRAMMLAIDGPRTAFAKRWIKYTITLRNVGNLPVNDVVVIDPLPEGLEFRDADQGGTFANRQVRWIVGTLAPNQSREMQLRVFADAEGEITQRPVATVAGQVRASGEITTRFQGAASFDFDAVVPLNEYAVEAGTVVHIQVPVYNPGTGRQKNVRVEVVLPPELEFQEGRFGKEKPRVEKERGKQVVVFEELPELPPNRTIVYEVDAVARKLDRGQPTAVTADVILRANSLPEPLRKPVAITIGEKQPP